MALARALRLFGAIATALTGRLVVDWTVGLVLPLSNTALAGAQISGTNFVRSHREVRSLSRHCRRCCDHDLYLRVPIMSHGLSALKRAVRTAPTTAESTINALVTTNTQLCTRKL